ncbi:hypothetical protein CEXT_13991 [Caerostris extrusa]|uniref:Uncharacterized protein n=1 Tax=Caerostris extrusa TaxID=172846 RepID=A0AAV4MCG3_CAEEX|nr:hypothetical protein CEXT_13991 [Caerostris extrusa]
MTAPNLEYIHVNDNIDLSLLKNCSKLKNINIHARSEDIDFDELIDILASLKNIETLEICIHNRATYREIEFFATILKLCPNLISIGNLDSLMVIEYCKNL